MKRHLLLPLLCLLACSNLLAQDDFLYPKLSPRGQVKHMVDTFFVSPTALDNYRTSSAECNIVSQDYDSQGRRLIYTQTSLDGDTLESLVYDYRDDATGYELLRDEHGDLQSVTKLFFDSKGRECRRTTYLTQSFLWNLPDQTKLTTYNFRGHLKREMTLSRHQRILSNLFYSCNHKGRLLRNEVHSPKGEELSNYIYRYTPQGDINWVGYYLYSIGQTETLYNLEFQYDSLDNWVQCVCFEGESKLLKLVVNRSYQCYD